MFKDFSVYLIIFLIITIVNVFYSYKTLFDSKNFLKKFNTPISAIFWTRGMGSMITAFTIIGIYILFRGAEGTWAYFVTLFVAYTLMTISGYYNVEIDYKNLKDSEEMKNVIVTKEGYIPTGILAILTAILIYGLSDKIYS